MNSRSPRANALRLALAIFAIALAGPARAASPPVAEPDDVIFDLVPGSYLVDVLANDSHPDGLPMTVEIVDPPHDFEGSPVGSLIGPRFDGSLTYVLAAPATAGEAYFTYELHDPLGGTSATVEVCLGDCGIHYITAAAMADTFPVQVGQTVVLDVLANDQGSGLVIVNWSSTALGTLVKGPGEAFTYTAQTVGQDSFVYTVRDSGGSESSAQVIVPVTADGPGPGPGPAQVMGYAGVVTGVTHLPTTVDLPFAFEHPVVIVQPITANGSASAVARLTDVQPSSFTVFVDEVPPADGGHLGEEVTYLVVEAGRWQIASGVVLEANVDTVQATTPFDATGRAVTFSQPLPTSAGPPTVLAEVQTSFDPSWVNARQDQVTGSGFELFLQRSKIDPGRHPAAERVGWVAISRGSGSWGGASPFIDGRATCAGGPGLLCQIPFGTSFAAPPVVVASLSTLAEADAAHLRRAYLSTTTTHLFLSEGVNFIGDTDTTHPAEEVSWLAVAPGSLSATPLDLPPVAEDVGPLHTVAGASPFAIGIAGSDPEEQQIALSRWTDPPLAGPLVPLLDLALEYYPPDQVPGGQQAVDTFQFTVSDPGGFESGWATVTVLVDPPPVTNLAPVAVDDVVSVWEDQCVRIASGDLLVNDSDPDGDEVLFTAVLSPPPPFHGALTLTGASPAGLGYEYCPYSGYFGPDSFDYEVTDGELTAQATVAITVRRDLPPVAVLPDPLCSGMTCAFDGSGSTDDLGVASWAWDFGDGTTGSGPTPIHDFPAGTFTVTLTVTDTAGQTGMTSLVLVFDGPPTAVIAAPVCTGGSCAFDGSGSFDDLGITGYAWDFGDGTTGSGPTPVHAFTTGTYTVTLTVTDTAGQTASAAVQVVIDLPPTAVFAFTCNELDCRFDGSGSTDDLGVASWAWDFGDGASATGPVADHGFPEEGAYTVTLTVTDTAGQTASTSLEVRPVDELTPLFIILW